ncbi:unnamed protein product [Rangifer tarandus platyrhynchus]|uniref:Uncharacterized protein n=2 Tax=Rangifer tarandus platyrhynchus TaxID=3082113 RepID=A0ABN8ZH28_RANTA|nr:unnamed protein product [Rangifer tarandus platyrhynchus]
MPPPKLPPRVGTGQDGRPWKSTGQGGKRVVAKRAPGGPPPSEARAGWAWPPAPTPFPPRNSPFIRSPSLGGLGATRWCFHSSCGEGGGKGSPLGNPLPGAPLKMVQTLPGQSRLPLPTRTHFWLRSSWYPSIETLTLDWVMPSLGLLGPPFPDPSLFPMSEDSPQPCIGNSPLALVEFIRPSVHPSVHPCPGLAARHP